MRVRCGIGYDLHRLAEGRKLIVGGIELAFHQRVHGALARRRGGCQPRRRLGLQHELAASIADQDHVVNAGAGVGEGEGETAEDSFEAAGMTVSWL